MFNEDDFYIDLLLCYLLSALPPSNTFSKGFPREQMFNDDIYVDLFSVIYSMNCLLPAYFSKLFPLAIV
jgi:hypothetical protein